MRYIVKVEELSAEVLMERKKNSRIIHIFSFVSASAALLLSVDNSDKRRVIDVILSIAEDIGMHKYGVEEGMDLIEDKVLTHV